MTRASFLLAALLGCASAPPPGRPGVDPQAPAWGLLPPALAVHPDALHIETLVFEPHQPDIATLGNGLTVYHLEDPTVPIVTVSLLVQAGGIFEPPDQVGLADVTAEAMRAGGAGGRTAEQLDDRLADLAASLELGAGDESTMAGLSVRARDAEEGFSLLADVVERPRFEQGRVQVVKLALENEIERRRDEPGSEAWRAFKKAVYGPASPWARETTRSTLARIDGAALAGWHTRYFQPGVSRLVITGAIPRAQARALAEKYFGAGAWPRKDVVLPEVPPVPREVKRKVIVVPREIAQAKVRIGHLGFTRHDPQEYAIRLADSVLGGALFVSRLAREIRSNRGLAYGISSVTSPGRDVGLFAVSADTRNDQVRDLVSISLELVDKMGTKPEVTDFELARAKDLFVNQFAFRFDTPRKAAMERATFDFYGYDESYLPTFPRRITAVTTAEIEAAARKVFHAGEAVIVIVGDPARMGDLTSLGPIQVIEDVEAWK